MPDICRDLAEKFGKLLRDMIDMTRVTRRERGVIMCKEDNKYRVRTFCVGDECHIVLPKTKCERGEEIIVHTHPPGELAEFSIADIGAALSRDANTCILSDDYKLKCTTNLNKVIGKDREKFLKELSWLMMFYSLKKEPEEQVYEVKKLLEEYDVNVCESTIGSEQ